MTGDEIRTVLLADPTSPLLEEVVIAGTIYGEGRSEPLRAQVAIGNVIQNRVDADLGSDKKPDWWGEGYAEVCLKRWQFSCWWEGGANTDATYSFAESLLLKPSVLLHPSMEQIRNIARYLRAGVLKDITSGANHYVLTSWYLNPEKAPAWTQGRTPTATVGAHSFFRL